MGAGCEQIELWLCTLDQRGLERAKLLLVLCALTWQFLKVEWEIKSNRHILFEFLCMGVLPSMPSSFQLGASSSQRRAEPAWDIFWGWMQSGHVDWAQ